MTTPLHHFASSLVSSFLRAGVFTCLLFLQLLPQAHGAPLTAGDEKMVRAVIEAQIAAFAKDDAAKAFSYAAPNIREALGTADAFLTMVRTSYPVVYRPSSVTFLKTEGKDDDVVQRVQMLDTRGKSYLAVYSLQRQKGNVWRISGCAVVENNGRMA